jgi:serine-type D-Ala-D-Ala carboxypeptidase (penicillin-binding protein 5/6)
MSVDAAHTTAPLPADVGPPEPPGGRSPRRPPRRRRGRRAWTVAAVAAGLAGITAAIGGAVGLGSDERALPPPAVGTTPVGDPGTGAPAVDAAAFLVAEADGTVLAASGADTPRAVGSLAKLMTAYVVYEAGDLERLVTVPDFTLAPDESNIGLVPGEQQTRSVLLRAMLIVSAGDAARALAVDVGGSEAGFVVMMQDAAAELGLHGTSFTNPVGLDGPDQHSTAADVLVLARRLMEREDFRATVARTDARLHDQVHPATNLLLGAYAGADGIKTGHTDDAGWCLVASATRDGRRVYVVVLGASSQDARDASAAALLDWAFASA